jgi:hypothetical protein
LGALSSALPTRFIGLVNSAIRQVVTPVDLVTTARHLLGPPIRFIEVTPKRLTIRGWLCDPETQGTADLAARMAVGANRIVSDALGS